MLDSPPNYTLPVAPPDLDAIEDGFNKAMTLYEEAFRQIEVADTAIKAAYAAIETVTPGAAFHHDRDGREVDEFNKAVQLPDQKRYLRTARKLMNLRCWHYVVDRCGLQQLMDIQAKKELDAQLRYVPDRPQHDRELIDEEEMEKGAPPFTAETVRATLAKFAGESGMIWRRGIANAFSALDRRFRSHDGFKVGSRLILTYFAGRDSGNVDTYGDSAERFRDIERTFCILDGIDPRHAQSSFLHRVNAERKAQGHRWSPMQSEHTTEYFKVRIFMNGNAHLWFTRDDLVEKVNKELAAYYGEVIGDGQTKEADPLENRALTPAKAFGFYPTPHDLAEKIVAQRPYSEAPRRILEPSAGTGNLAYLLAKGREITTRDEWDEEKGGRIREHKTVHDRVDAVELQPALARALQESGRLNRVLCADFLQLNPEDFPKYDGIVANPPFDMERDIDHVTHALKFVKEGGFLLAIMSAGTEFRETRKAAAFRKLLAERKGWMTDLPAGSFADVGTCVNTVLVGIGCGERSWRF